MRWFYISVICFMGMVTPDYGRASYLEEDDGKKRIPLHQNIAQYYKDMVQTAKKTCIGVDKDFSSTGLDTLESLLTESNFPVGFQFLTITTTLNQQIADLSSPASMEHFKDGSNTMVTALGLVVHELARVNDHIRVTHHGALVHDLSDKMSRLLLLIDTIAVNENSNWVLRLALWCYLRKQCNE